MSSYYYAINSKGEYLFDNFPPSLVKLATFYTDNSKLLNVVVDGTTKAARLGKKTNVYGTIFTLTTEAKYVNRLKLFKELLDMSTLALGPLVDFQKSIVEKQ